MSIFLILAFLFCIGALFGWVLELFFRRFVSASNPERKWINPGFCIGPYIPLYGFGLCLMYLLAQLDRLNITGSAVGDKALLFIIMAVCMTAIEYIAGVMCIKLMNVRLWDYSGEWGNLDGIICPKFSVAWAFLGAVYYFGVHPYILDALAWLSENLAFSFVVGMFYGVFIIDVAQSMQLVVKIKQFARDNDVIVKFEYLKSHIRSVQDKAKEKHYFLFPFHSKTAISEHLKNMHIELSERFKK